MANQAKKERTQGPADAIDDTALAKAYRPGDIEHAVYQSWLDADVFNPDGAGSRADWSKPPFVIIQPPPNVTGSLHLGHAQRSTVEDLMTRHARMQGRPALFLPGLDHASIAAQYVLDKLLAKKGETRATLGREKYLEAMWEFVRETRETILSQQRRVGASLDMTRLRFTMDEVSARAVREAFLRLYREGLAYRTEALIHWCPGCRTSVSDLEVIPKETTGSLWTMRYHLIDQATGAPDPNAWIAVATTRPETLLGDTAVAVNPEDPRYTALIGREAMIPFVDRVVPIIADPVVDRAFGTGAVKITPAHDQDDYETGKRHGLPMITVLDDAARINENGAQFAGLDRYEARQPDRGGSAGPRRPRVDQAPRDDARALPALRRRGRAAAQDPVVRARGAARGGGPGGDPLGHDSDPAGAFRQGLGTLDDRDARLERQPPALVGPPHPGLVLPGRPHDRERRSGGARPPARSAAGPPPTCARTRTSSTPGSARACGRSRRSAGRSRPSISSASIPAR